MKQSSINSIQSESESLRAEARAILGKHRLRSLLAQYGSPVVTGSYALDLMTWRDLDIYLIVKNYSEQHHFELGSELARCFRPFKMTYRNTVRRGDQRLPKGWYWGVYTDWLFGKTWKIDLWAIGEHQAAKHQRTLDTLSKWIDKEKKIAILHIKDHYCRHQLYRKAFTSIDIYRAVCREGIETIPEFAEWLQIHRGIR